MDYQLVVRIPYSAVDDVQARDWAENKLSGFKGLPESTVIKVQRLIQGQKPMGVKLNGHDSGHDNNQRAESSCSGQ